MRLLSVFLSALLFMGCDTFQSTGGLSGDDLTRQVQKDDFILGIDETSVADLKKQFAVFRIVNTSPKDKIFSFRSGCQFAFTLEWEDELLLDSREGIFCTAALTSFTVQPGEKKEFNIDFDAARYSKRISDINIGSNRAGRYTLTAFLRDDQSPELSVKFVVK